MPTIEIGCGQITWSNDTPEDQVLAEIAQAGYAGAPAGPSAGRTAEQTQAVFARHGLKPAPGYLGADFWNPEQHDSILRAEIAKQLSSMDGSSRFHVDPTAVSGARGCRFSRRNTGVHTNGRSNQGRGQKGSSEPRPSVGNGRRMVGCSLV